MFDDDPNVIEEEAPAEVTAPAVDEEKAPAGGDPIAARLAAERDTLREDKARLEGELEALRESGRPKASVFDEKADREMFEKDPYAWHREQLAQVEAKRDRDADQREAKQLIASSPYGTLKGEAREQFNKRMGEILDDLYPGDSQYQGVKAAVQYRVALKQYERLYGEKARDEIRTVPASGKTGTQTEGPVTEVSVEMLHEARKNWAKPPFDKQGRGKGEAMYAEWNAKGLLDKTPAGMEDE